MSINSSAVTTYTEYGNDGTNIIFSGVNSVTLLVETLNYRPSTGGFVPSTTGSPVSTSLFPALPALLAEVNVTSENYWQDLASQSSIVGSTINSGFNAGTSATLLNAQRGDVNADGVVNFADLAVVIADYGQTTSLWAAGNFNSASDGKVDISDLDAALANLTGPVPSTYAFPPAVLADPNAVAALEHAGIQPAAVPEPASLGMIALAAGVIAGRGRRRPM
jgi:hypothetical protein